MTNDPHLSQGAESHTATIEAPVKQDTAQLQTYKEASEIAGNDPNRKAIDAILKLSPENEPGSPESLEGVFAIQRGVGTVLAKIVRKYKIKPAMLEKLPPHLLMEFVNKHPVKQDLIEPIAIQKFEQLIATPGPMGEYMVGSWGSLKEQAIEGSKGWTAKSVKWVKDNPRTAVFIGLAAVGLYVFSDEIAGLFTGKKSDKNESGGKWFGKKVVLPIALAIAAYFMGKEQLMKLLGGLNLTELQDIIKAGKALPKEALEAAKEKRDELVAKAKKTATGAKEKVDKGVETVTEEFEKDKFNIATELLVNMFCYDKHRYSKADANHIKQIFKNMKGFKMSEIIAHWNKYKKDDDADQSTKGIPREGFNLTNDQYEPEVIYSAFEIINKSYEGYCGVLNKKSPSDQITLEQFLEDHIGNDPVFEINAKVHESIKRSASSNDLTAIFSSIKAIDEVYANKKDEYINHLCKTFDINLEGPPKSLKRDFFAIIATTFVQGVNINDSVDEALKNVHSSRSTESVELARKFYLATQKYVKEDVLPGCIERFGLGHGILDGALKPQKITFGKSLALALVSSRIDLKVPAKSQGQIQELALFYSMLNSLESTERNKYLGLLATKALTSPTSINMPSIKAIMPYIKSFLGIIWNTAKNKGSDLLAFTSGFATARTLDGERQFQEDLTNAGGLDFALMTLNEGGRGSIRILGDIGSALLKTGVSILEWRDADGFLDFSKLVLASGGTFLFSTKDGPGVLNIAGENFVIEPLGIAGNTAVKLIKGDVEGAVKEYAIGVAPFIAVGAIGGLVLKRSAKSMMIWGVKGALWPYFGPKMALKAGITTSMVAVEAIKRPRQVAGDLLRWGKDVYKYRAPFSTNKNVFSLLHDIKRLEQYVNNIEDIPLERWFQLKPHEMIQRGGKEFSLMMSKRYAYRVAARYQTILGKGGYINTAGIKGAKTTADLYQEITKISAHASKLEKSFTVMMGNQDGIKHIMTLMEDYKTNKSAIQIALKKFIGTGTDFAEMEIKSMMKIMKTERSINAFLGRLDDAAKHFGHLDEATAGVASTARAASVLDTTSGRSFNSVSENGQSLLANGRTRFTLLEKANKELSLVDDKIKHLQSSLKKLSKVQDAELNLLIKHRKGLVEVISTTTDYDAAWRSATHTPGFSPAKVKSAQEAAEKALRSLDETAGEAGSILSKQIDEVAETARIAAETFRNGALLGFTDELKTLASQDSELLKLFKSCNPKTAKAFSELDNAGDIANAIKGTDVAEFLLIKAHPKVAQEIFQMQKFDDFLVLLKTDPEAKRLMQVLSDEKIIRNYKKFISVISDLRYMDDLVEAGAMNERMLSKVINAAENMSPTMLERLLTKIQTIKKATFDWGANELDLAKMAGKKGLGVLKTGISSLLDDIKNIPSGTKKIVIEMTENSIAIKYLNHKGKEIGTGIMNGYDTLKSSKFAKAVVDFTGIKKSPTIRFINKAGETIGKAIKVSYSGISKGLGATIDKAVDVAKAGRAQFAKMMPAMKDFMEFMKATKLDSSDLKKLAKLKDVRKINAFLSKRGLELSLDTVEKMRNMNKVDDIKAILQTAAQENKLMLRFVKGAKIMRIAGRVGSVGVAGLAFVPAIFNFIEAAYTDNDEMRDILINEGSMNLAFGAADVGFMTAGALGVGATGGGVVAGLGLGGVGALALAPFMYMGDKIFESKKEDAMRPQDWAQTYDKQNLIHEWISTGHAQSAGESYRFLTDFKGVASLKAKISRNIVKAILLNEPNRLNIGEKEKEYREAYIEKVTNGRWIIEANFSTAKQTLHASNLFAEVMMLRDAKLEQGETEFKLGSNNLLEPSNNHENITKINAISFVREYESIQIKEVAGALSSEFRKFSSGQLIEQYIELFLAISKNKKAMSLDPMEETDLSVREMGLMNNLKQYLFYYKHIDVNEVVQNRMYQVPNNVRAAIMERVEKEMDDRDIDDEKIKNQLFSKYFKEAQEAQAQAFLSGSTYSLSRIKKLSLDYINADSKGLETHRINPRITDTAACYAVYKLAEYFGYSGFQNEDELKTFFDRAHAGTYGIYWDGDEWVLNEGGWNIDDDLSSTLTQKDIQEIINGFFWRSDDTLEHRNETLVDAVGGVGGKVQSIYSGQMAQMQSILVTSYNSYKDGRDGKVQYST